MAKSKKTKKTSSAISIGSINGPVHTGNGDMHIEQVNYGETNKIDFHQEILKHMEGMSKNFIKSITLLIDQLNDQQMTEVFYIQNLLEENHLCEKDVAPILSELQSVLNSLENKAVSLDLAKNVKTTAKIIATEEMSVNHKLKLSLPLIPLLLNYEGEIGLDTTMNLKRAWNWLKGKVTKG